MTTDPPDRRTLSRRSLSFIMLAFIVVGVIVTTESPLLGVLFLVAMVLLGAVAWNRLRPKSGTGLGILSSNCEKCGALLQGAFGLPTKSCSECGHAQSWAP
ncbi:MAG: hypothetical protein WA359_08430 [Acidimicrobiales bacterium]